EEVTLVLSPGNGYTVDSEAGRATLTIADDPTSQIQVSLATEPDTLIESEATVSTHTFTLSATPPAEGVTVFVNAPNLDEFDIDGIDITGGSIVAATDTGFAFNITDRQAVISLPVANDGEAEGLETATFSLEVGEGYQIDPDANSGTFAIADTSDQLPLSETEANDTIPLAFATELSSSNPLSISGEIAAHGEGAEAVDASEDVDFYSFELQAGETVSIDLDAIEYSLPGIDVPQQLDSALRLFSANGEELAIATGAPLSFTAATTGTYFVGVGQTGNTIYDPFISGSGSGRIDPAAGINTGAYTLSLSVSAAGDLLDLRNQNAETVRISILDKLTEAGFVNVVGFYRIEDASGAVIDPLTGNRVSPGDQDYTLAAVRRSQVSEDGLSFGIRDTEAVVTSLQGDSLYAPFIIANGTVEQVLTANEKPDVFFDFTAANLDGFDHVQQPAPNQFAFEDLRFGGDRNFKDAVFSVQLEPIA
ncbi:MAG: DUF4114 domain-containing protein, partial [Microcoleus sp. SIO2G3]|nr:DUF4114 domain-containing protein [Microcoleus sp. SIO2G3]